MVTTLRARLAARPRKQTAPGSSQKAAVLIPLITRTGGFDLLFTLRTDLVETHKGQVSFPGGVVDPEDRDPVHTALRELEEELGVPSSLVSVAGLLDDLATPTGFIITPVIGVLESTPPLSPNRTEVAEVFQAPLDFFASKENGTMEQREIQGRVHEVWFFQYGEHTIWGVTAAIIRSFLRVLDSP